MGATTIDYGNGRLELARSDSLVALRARCGSEALLAAALEAQSPWCAIRRVGSLGRYTLARLERSPAELDEELRHLGQWPHVEFCSAVYHTSGDGIPFVPTGEIHLGFEPEAPVQLQADLMIDLGLQLVEERDDGSLVVRTTKASPDPVTAVETLQQSDGVAFAEPDLATPLQLKSDLATGESLLHRMWHLRNTGGSGSSGAFFKRGADARVVEAWQALAGFGSPQALVGVIDAGFDLEHPDIAGKAAHPWDFEHDRGDFALAGESEAGRAAAWHGTACAAIAVGNPSGETIGVAPGGRLVPVRTGPLITDRLVEAWFAHMVRHDAWVVSCSWGAAARNFPLSRRKREALSLCATTGRRDKGCVVVFAAGNDNRNIDEPEAHSVDGFAVHPEVITVAASNSRDLRAHYSNYGDAIWICAPSSGAGGAELLGPRARHGHEEAGAGLGASGWGRASWSQDPGGTSSAASLIAGVCALILSANPDLTAAQVKTVLRHSARRIGHGYDGRLHSRLFGYGCVNAAAAVRLSRGFNVVSLPQRRRSAGAADRASIPAASTP